MPLGCASAIPRRSHTRTTRTQRDLRDDHRWHRFGHIGTDILLSDVFDGARITELRHAVSDCAATAGLGGARLEDFVVAVNELLTNAVRHGGGSGRLVLSCDGAAVICAVSDHGAGLAETGPPQRPEMQEPGGWGLWLAAHLTDTFDLQSGADGTTARISTRLT